MHDRHETALRRELAAADAVQPAPALPEILQRSRANLRRETWFLAFVFTVAALATLLILAGLLICAQEQPAPAPTPQTISTRLWEA